MKALLYTILCILVIANLYKSRSLMNMVLVGVVMLSVIIHEYNIRYNARDERELFNEGSATTTMSKTNTELMYENRNLFADFDYVEDISNLTSNFNAYNNELVFYVSTFDKINIDWKNNALINKIPSGPSNESKLSLTETNEMNKIFNQSTGLKIANLVNLPSAKQMLENIDSFTIFMYIKLDTAQIRQKFEQGGDHPFSLLKFDHHNVISDKLNYDLFDVVLRFHGAIDTSDENYNPNIELYVADKLMEVYYVWNPQHFFENKLFTDNKFHLLTFVKGNMSNEDGDGDLTVYLDNIPLIECQNCVHSTEFRTYDSDNMEIRNTPIRMNDQTVRQAQSNNIIGNIDMLDTSSTQPLEFRLSAMGILRGKALTLPEVEDMWKYFKGIENHLSPEMQQLFQENRLLKADIDENQKYIDKMKQTDCPFSSSICESVECKYINNWENINELVDNPLCFQKLNTYCDSKTNFPDKEWLCKYIKSENVGKMARNISTSSDNFRDTFGEDIPNESSSCSNRNGAPPEVANLKDIHLDNTYRNTSGKYDSEMHRLVGDIIENKGVIDPSLVRALRTTQNVGNSSPDRDSSGLVDVDSLINLGKVVNKNDTQETSDASNTDDSFEKLKALIKDSEAIDLQQPSTDKEENPYNKLLDKYESRNDKQLGWFEKWLKGWF